MHTAVTVLFRGTGDGGRGGTGWGSCLKMGAYEWKEKESACGCMIELCVCFCVCVSVNSTCRWANYVSGTKSLNSGELSELCWGRAIITIRCLGEGEGQRETEGDRVYWCVFKCEERQNWKNTDQKKMKNYTSPLCAWQRMQICLWCAKKNYALNNS